MSTLGSCQSLVQVRRFSSFQLSADHFPQCNACPFEALASILPPALLYSLAQLWLFFVTCPASRFSQGCRIQSRQKVLGRRLSEPMLFPLPLYRLQ